MSGWPSRARSAIVATLWQLPQRRFACRWRRQRSHIGAPSSSCAATGLTCWQWVQAAAPRRWAHRAHIPPWSQAVSGWLVRAHTMQEGAARVVDPRLMSSTLRRPTNGGAPVCSTSGFAASALASTPTAWPEVTIVSNASVTTLGGSDGSAAITAVRVRARRQGAQGRPVPLG